MAWTWDFMLLAFNSLGGQVENIVRKPGATGRGIVAADPKKTVRMLAPPNLIFPVSDVEFVDGRLKIKSAAAIGAAERTFFENYYDSFSWNPDGRDEALAFLAKLEELPPDIRTLLSTDFGMRSLFEGGDARGESWFLANRMFEWRGQNVLVPVLEMVDHDPLADPYGEDKGVFIGGEFPEDVRVLRSKLSPLGAFIRFGAASPECVAFSQAMSFKTKDGCEIKIGRDVNANSTLGSVAVPDYELLDQAIRFSCLMIGNSRLPRLARAIFYRVMKDARQPDAEQVFDRIAHENRLIFLRLLEALEPYNGGLIPTLRTVVRYQLEAMSWCIGTRDL
jgi:hypothetical protein